MSEQAEDALLRLGRISGDDLILLQPLGEAHFDPVSATIGFGGLLVSGFFTGMTGGFGASVEESGRRAGEWLRDRLHALFSSGHGPEAAVVAAVAQEASDVLNDKTWIQAAREARRLLADALVANGLPAERASALSEQVQLEALDLLEAGK